MIYDTLIEGCGYFSAGYALARESSVICEERQICDTGFYLPMRTFTHLAYEPRTDEGEAFLEYFDTLGLFKDGEQCLNRFESAFCKFLIKKQIKVYLKCKIVNKKRLDDGTWDVTVQSNAGLSHIYARNVISTKSTSKILRYTVLFMSDDIVRDREILLSAFDDSEIEHAFFDGRYALHMRAECEDVNEMKLAVYNTWQSLDTEAKILYMAPSLYSETSDPYCDDSYGSPIEAFEAGYLRTRESDL